MPTHRKPLPRARRKPKAPLKKIIRRRPRPAAPEAGWWGSVVEASSLLLPSFLMVLFAGGLLWGTLRGTARHADRPQAVAEQPVRPLARHRDQVALNQRFSELKGAPLHERVKSWSHWLKENYAGFQSGWVGMDRAGKDVVAWFPRELDCTTFVETVLALAASGHLGTVPEKLHQVRYQPQSVARVASRNHFPETDWTPNLLRLGWARDVTAAVAGGQEVADLSTLTTLTKAIEREAFVARLEGRKPASARAQEVNLSILTAAAMRDRLSSLPRVGVLNWVRRGVSQRPSIVSHQGILFQNGGEAWMVHVPVKAQGRIQSLPVIQYLEQHPDLLGAQILQMQEPPLTDH